MGIRSLRRQTERLLRAKDFQQHLHEWKQFPARQIINPLFASLCNQDELLKMRAVQVIGIVVAQLADQDRESARVIMRRLIWNLNDESGGIGWGCPEAMGEIMASHEGMAEEYAQILVSFIREDGNLLDYNLLLRGALWGVGRLAQARPHLLKDSVPSVRPYLASEDAPLRGFAAWALGSLRDASSASQLKSLLGDSSEITLYTQGQLKHCRVGELAAQALALIEKASSKSK